jgi:exonuclease SbcC
MRLKRLKLVNFRNHKSTDLILNKKINLFFGENGSGKSSIAHAIAFLYTGITNGTAKSGEGMNELMTFGESRALVSAEHEGIGNITRTIPHSFEVKGWEGTMTSQVDKLFNTLGCTEEQFLCTVYGSRFIDMPSNEQKNFMFNLVGLKMSNERVKREFLDWCDGNSVENGEALWNYVERDANFKENPDEFDRLFEIYCGIRKQLKRDLKGLEVLSKSYISKLTNGLTIEHKDIVIKQLDVLRKEKDELLLKLGTARSQERLRKVLEDKANRQVVVPAKTSSELRVASDESVKKYTVLNKKIAQLEAKIDEYNRHITKLSNFDGKCPLSSAILCDKKADLEALVRTFTDDREAVKIKLDITKTEMAVVSKEVESLALMIDQRTKADILLPEIEKAKAELASMNKEVANIEELDKAIQVIDGRISNGQAIYTQILAEIQNKNAEEDAKRNLEKKTAELVTIQMLIDAFGPKGLKSTMLNKAMKPLEEKINERLQILTNGKYSINFRVDEDDYNIFITSDGMERRVRHLSSSERLRVGIIMQDAINRLTGLKLLIVDEVDMLDAKNRSLFWELIMTIKDDYESILLMITGEPMVDNPFDDVGIFTISHSK